MQTFLPYADFAMSAEVLDTSRLGKQRVENFQIMKVLSGLTNGWQNHPAVRMWRGYRVALLDYQHAICHEWVNVRGYKDTCLDKTFHAAGIDPTTYPGTFPREYPTWLGDDEFHLSHQSNLVRKFPERYREFFPDVPDNLDYIWPV